MKYLSILKHLFYSFFTFSIFLIRPSNFDDPMIFSTTNSELIIQFSTHFTVEIQLKYPILDQILKFLSDFIYFEPLPNFHPYNKKNPQI